MLYKGRKLWLVCAFLFFCLTGFGFFGCVKSKESPAQRPEDTSAIPEGSKSLLSDREKLAFYRWLFREMYSVVYAGKVSATSGDESAWLNVLSQGASIEGVYHGLVLSTNYAALEKGTASPAALRFFALEYTRIRERKFVVDDALMAKVNELTKQSLNASLFTLKRELGEVLLSLVDSRKSNREELAEWYATLSVDWSRQGVELGMKQRENSDKAFHRNWAMTNNLGLLQWELLNRAHRILNRLGGLAAPERK